MRSDTNLKQDLSKEKGGEYQGLPGIIDTEARNEAGERILRSHSMSGSEANSFFYNADAKGFVDASAVSGLDHLADGRSFAYLDFDRDGWTDVALVNSNNPQLVLYRNELASELGDAAGAIAVQLRGGNRGAQGSADFSNRDGFGAQILVSAGGLRLHRELRGGDGFAAQNSRVPLIGINGSALAETVTVKWPSGKMQTAELVPAGSLVTFDEAGIGSAAVTVEPYRKEIVRAASEVDLGAALEFPTLPGSGSPRVLVTMATWCAACQAAQPQIAHLVAQRPDLAFVGVPVDGNDSAEMLASYVADQKPAYQLATSLTAAERDLIDRLLTARLGEAFLPSSIVLDAAGHVRGVFAGVPSASEIGQALE